MKYLFCLSIILASCAFGAQIDLAGGRLETKNAAAAVENGTLRIDFSPELDWPNAILHGKWNFTPDTELSAVFRNESDTPVRLEWRIANPGGNWAKDSLTERVPLLAGEERRVSMKLVRKAAGKDEFRLHGMKQTPIAFASETGIDPGNVVKMEFILPRGCVSRSVSIRELTASGEFQPLKGNPLPLIDRFGQYRHADWPGKIKSPEQLKTNVVAEEKELTARPAPAEWNQYGGWANGPQLEATGTFRTALDQNRWTLVDPEGKLFFSIGMNHVNIGGIHSSTALFRRNGWFEELPSPNEPVNQQFYFVRYIYTGDYAGNYSPGFSFISYNLFQKYGADWQRKAAESAPRRLRSWGFNTIANWSDNPICAARQLPYTVGIALAGRGAQILGGGQWRVGSMWDVYAPNFPKLVDDSVRSAGTVASSPWCIGIFFDNELHWAANFAKIALGSDPGQPAKRALIGLLRDKYGEIGALNKAYGTSASSWEEFAALRQLPDESRAAADFDAFYARTAEIYYRTIRDSIRKIHPGRLYLGARFASSQYTPLSYEAAANYCDVVSINLYLNSLEGFRVSDRADAPLMATEFHFGATDRGMFGGGLAEVKSQQERAESFRRYAESALKHRQFVGIHYFQYVDQPVTGRIFDGENFNIGFLDVTDRPYPEMVEASRAVADRMYRFRFGGE